MEIIQRRVGQLIGPAGLPWYTPSKSSTLKAVESIPVFHFHLRWRARLMATPVRIFPVSTCGVRARVAWSRFVAPNRASSRLIAAHRGSDMCNSSPRTPQDTISGNQTMKVTLPRIPPASLHHSVSVPSNGKSKGTPWYGLVHLVVHLEIAKNPMFTGLGTGGTP